MENRPYTVSEIATMYGVSTKTIRNWISQGAPTEGKKQLRGRWPTDTIDQKKLQKWLDDQRRVKPIRKL